MSLAPVTPDAARLRRTLHKIRTDPDSWVQSAWATQRKCGTAYCFAGWALVLDGIPVCTDDCYPSDSGMIEGTAHVHGLYMPGDMRTELKNYAVPTRDDDSYDFLHPVSVSARYLLGLRVWESDMLFCAVNSLDAITQMVERLCAVAQEARR